MLRSRLAESTRAFRDAFANPALRRMQLALAGSVIGDWAALVALAVYAYEQGGATALGLVSMTRWLLAAAAGPFVGPAIGGLLLAITGVGTVFALDAVTFVWSLLLVAAIHAPDDNPRAGASADSPQGLGGEVLEGFRVVGADRRLRLIIGLFGAQTIVSGALTVLIVVMALELLSLGNGGVGTLNATVGIGGVLGSLVAFGLVGRGKLAS